MCGGGVLLLITSWNDEEDAALRGLPWMARVLYLQGLRRHMDYSTGLVGLSRRISYQSMREVLEVHRDLGSKLEPDKVTNDQIRAALAQLERAKDADGHPAPLIARVRQPGQGKFAPLVFRLLLATVKKPDSSGSCPDFAGGASIRPNEEPQENPKGGTPSGAPRKAAVIPLYIVEPQEAAGEGTPKEPQGRNHTPPGSGNNNHTLPVRPDDEILQRYELRLVPTKTDTWACFMAWARMFQFHIVKQVAVIQLFREWVNAGVRVEQMLDAMHAAEAKLGRVPDSPLYYRNFVAEVLLVQSRQRQGYQPPNAGGHRHGNKPSAAEMARDQLGGGSRVYDNED